MPRTNQASRSGPKPRLQDAPRLTHQFLAVMEALSDSTELSDEVRDALDDVVRNFDGDELEAMLDRAMDELDHVSPTRVDTDAIEDVSDEAKTCFEEWDNGRGEPDRDEERTGEDFDLIQRFMRSHGKIEIVFDVDRDFSTRGRYNNEFGIKGPKAARKRFLADKRWPKLLEALEDIYDTDYQGGEERSIKNPMRYVFGGG